MRDHAREFRLIAMCRVLGVQRSGYYAWQRSPHSARAKEIRTTRSDQARVAWTAGSIYGHRKIAIDLRELGEVCSRHRVRRLMKQDGLRALVGYGSVRVP